MPLRYTPDTLSELLNPRIRLSKESAKLMAVRGYSGRWTRANYREHESRFLAAVEKAGLAAVGLL